MINKKSQFIKIHFIGIGGIGISALAQWLLRNPRICTDLLPINTDTRISVDLTRIKLLVSGSDLENSDIIMDLKKLGAKIKIGPHKVSNLDPKTNLVIYSNAIRPDNPELKKAKKLLVRHSLGVGGKIKTLSYPEALGILTKKFYTIAVCGTHGKSTTTAMLSLILIKAGLDPTVVIGTKLKELGGGNFRLGESNFLLIEADEYRGAFLNYWPKVIILTNIEAEHLDYYKNLKNILRAFQEYVLHLSDKGVLIASKDDKNVCKMLISNFPFDRLRVPSKVEGQFLISKKIKNSKFKIQNYSIRDKKDFLKLKKAIKVPGTYNISNALAALTAARSLGVKDSVIFKALSEYKGSWRRFEIIKAGKITIISDYAHHPTEIKATLQAMREKFPKKRIICAFQPHQEQRLKVLFDNFVKAFKGVENLILVESFKVAGREKKGKVSNTQKLAQAISRKHNQSVSYAPTLIRAKQIIKKNIQSNDAVLIMGAGDVYKLGYRL